MATAESWKLLNVRVSPELRAMVEEAAARAETASLSEWVRDALEAMARQDLHSRQEAEARRLGVSRRAVNQPLYCVHPTPARKQTVEAEVCGLCGTVTRTRL